MGEKKKFFLGDNCFICFCFKKDDREGGKDFGDFKKVNKRILQVKSIYIKGFVRKGQLVINCIVFIFLYLFIIIIIYQRYVSRFFDSFYVLVDENERRIFDVGYFFYFVFYFSFMLFISLIIIFFILLFVFLVLFERLRVVQGIIVFFFIE